MQTIRELPVQACEVMLDIGNLEWLTVYVVGKNALIQLPSLRATQLLLQSKPKQHEVIEHLIQEFDVTCVMFPPERG
jgi:hypothetical protein